MNYLYAHLSFFRLFNCLKFMEFYDKYFKLSPKYFYFIYSQN